MNTLVNNFFQKIKQFFKKPIGVLLALFIVLLLLFTIIIRFMGGDSSTQVAKKMQDQKEQLVQSNIRYTTQETLNTLTGETDNLTQSVHDLQQQFKKTKDDADNSQKAMQDMVQKEINALQVENQKLKESVSNAISAMKRTKEARQGGSHGNFSYEINGATTPQSRVNNDFIWVRDSSASSVQPTKITNSNSASDSATYDVDSGGSANRSLLHSKVDSGEVEKLPSNSTRQSASDDNKPEPTPFYTIPPDSWATGVIIEQPLIGVIPNNRSLLNPQTVTFAIGKKNLAANNWRLPAAISGIQGTAICQGVFVTFSQSYVQCDVTSLTFIFKDGRITTIKGTKDEPLGKITTRYGSPYIPGKYHGNAAFAATGTGLFSGLQGFGNAFAASQQEILQGSTSNLYQIKDTTKYGVGSAVGSMGEAWNDWWHDLLKSTTNFVYSSNWDETTHKLKRFNIKISQAVPIDYDLNGRKVNYEKDYKSQFDTNSLD